MNEKQEEADPIKKKRTPRVWHTQQEKILKTWGEACSCYRFMHNKAYQKFKKLSMRFTLPIIVISTVTGTANFAQTTFPKSWMAYVPLVIGAFNLFAAIMTTVLQFLKVNELMESHRVTAIQYGKLARNIRLELAMPLAERKHDGYNMVEICRAEYDRLIEQSPPVPKDVLLRFENDIESNPIPSPSNTFTRPEILTVAPIDMFDNKAEAERLKHEREQEREEKKREYEQRFVKQRRPVAPPPTTRSDTSSVSVFTPRRRVIEELESLRNRNLVSRGGCFYPPDLEEDREDPFIRTRPASPEQIEIDVPDEEPDTQEEPGAED
jgi:hypothetical protein